MEAISNRSLESTIVLSQDKQSAGSDLSGISLTIDKDQMGRIVRQEINIEGFYYVSEYFYDQKGRLIRFTDNLNEFREYEYNDAGKIARIKRPDGYDLIFRYDEKGKIKRIDLPWGYSILYQAMTESVTKSLIRFGKQKIFELSYRFDETGKKTMVKEKIGDFECIFNYFYDLTGNIIEILDSLGHKSQVVSGNGHVNKVRNLDRIYVSVFDFDGNPTYLRHRSGLSEVYRYFNERKLLEREIYYQKGQKFLDVRYRYNSSGQLVLKEINNTILILYLRDKDGNLIHKIINNLRSGEVYDQVFYKPAKLDFDTEGFELIRYPSKESSQIKETLLFKDIEGNIRIVIDIFDALRIHESFIQRTVLNDGVLLPEYEFVLNTLAEIAKNQKIGPRGLFYRLYDIYPEPETVWGDNLVSIESAQAGDTCCYSYGWCPPECSSCIECSGGGGGVGGGDPGGGGGGGGSWNEECLASIAGPTLVFSNSLETYTLSTTCPDPYGITWYGGYGLNNGGLSYTTFWDSPGVYIVSVHFTISETVGITVDDDNNPDTPPKIYFQIVTVGKSASLSVEVFDEDQDIINPPRPSDGENLSIRIINVYSPSGNGSFVAKRLGDGDIINIYGEAFYGEIDLSNQIIWSAIDYPGDGIDSGSVIPSTSTGAIYSFVPSPPPAPAGRTGPLKYIIRAQITYNGITKEASTVVSQDNLDELRQEYEDIVACTPQPRWVFDTEPAAFSGLLATAAEPTRFQWHILRNLNQYAAQANSIFIVKGYGPGINFTSGYRTPRGNYLTSGSAANSNHLYGRAFDFQQSDSWGNYYAYLAAYSAGARADTYLLLSNNNDKIFWRDNPPAPNNLPPGINYVRGHAAWGQ